MHSMKPCTFYVFICHRLFCSLMSSLSHPAVEYSLEADADHRKNGLIPRATFTDSSASDNSYEAKGTVTLNGQGTKQCVKRKLAMQVLALARKFPFLL